MSRSPSQPAASRLSILNSWFDRRARGHALVSVQDPIRLPPHSEPEPDIALLRPRSDFYAGSHPGPEDVLLIVEVADTSLEYDRETKSPLYARAGIPELWIVDLDAESVEVFRGPEALPDLILRVDEILGEERER